MAEQPAGQAGTTDNRDARGDREGRRRDSGAAVVNGMARRATI